MQSRCPPSSEGVDFHRHARRGLHVPRSRACQIVLALTLISAAQTAAAAASGWWSKELVDGTTFDGTSLALDTLGRAVIAHGGNALRVAQWDGSAWTIETIEGGWSGVYDPSLALDSAGQPIISYSSLACSSLLVVRRRVDEVLYRGVVPDLAPGWKDAALPLTGGNDDATSPFPIYTVVGGKDTDRTPPPVPLVLYRVLLGGTLEAGNVLRAVKGQTEPGTVDVSR